MAVRHGVLGLWRWSGKSICRQARMKGRWIALALVAVTGVVPALRAQTIPTISCQSDPNSFNTGYDPATGGVYPTQIPWYDNAYWQATRGSFLGSGNIQLPPACSVFSTTGVYWDSQWDASPYANANWAWLEYGHNVLGNIDLWYRLQFNLDATVNPANLALQMDLMADYAVMEVFVNGVAQSSKTAGFPQNTAANPANAGVYANPYGYMGFRAWRRAQTTLDHDWQAGLNTIIVQIKSSPPLEGFLAMIRPNTPLCVASAGAVKVPAVPTLGHWSLALLAALTALFAVFTRRSRC